MISDPTCYRWILGMAFLWMIPECSTAESVNYNQDVRPILSDRCFICHGPDSENRKADLRLDQSDIAYSEIKGSNGRHYIDPGNPDNSELITRIFTEDPDDQMPPSESNLSLSDAERNTLLQWVREGAEYQGHCAFTPLRPVKVPTVENSQHIQNPIDQLVQSNLEKELMVTKPEASAER
ncbi:MAG TPA: hypothetical protein EYG38_03025, partial [Verrucomicrobia bacterium]|nr:hypothetical protein [Verrucomicrobiota bacterium]